MQKKILVFGLIFFLLGSLLIYDQFFSVKKEANTKEQKLLSFEKLDISRIRVLGTVDSAVDISKAETVSVDSPLLHRANWVLKDPFFAPVSDEVLDELLEAISAISGVSVSPSELKNIDEASLGLTPPDLILIIDKNKGGSEVVSFGSKSEISGARYIQREGDPQVYYTRKDFPRFFSSIKDRIKSREVLKIDPQLITGIDVIEGKTFYRLKSNVCEDPSSGWVINASKETWLADSEFLARKIEELSHLSVSRIFETPIEIFPFTGLDDPFLILNISFQVDDKRQFVCDKDRKKELLLQFGKGLGIQRSEAGTLETGSSYFLKIGGEVRVYEIEKKFFSDWLQGPYHFRSRTPLIKVFNEDSPAPVSITIRNPETSCAVVLGESGVSEHKELVNQVKKNLMNISFDAIVLEEELSLYSQKDGFHVEIMEEQVISLSEVARLKEEGLADEGTSNIPLILRVQRPSESPFYGVLRSSEIESLLGNISSFCNTGMH
jgi:hypothetical protein